MFAAELGGKLPPAVRLSEDILTSYVFGFLQYADRERYLHPFLSGILGLDVTPVQAKSAEFMFWPKLPDGTEPDVVVVVADLYVLFEAKLFAGFGPGTMKRDPQLERELREGRRQAVCEGKDFRMVVVTAGTTRPLTLEPTLGRAARAVTWVSWQHIAHLILRAVEEAGPLGRAELFARDLLAVLDARGLRGFDGFAALTRIEIPKTVPQALFIQAETIDFRGTFIGFQPDLWGAAPVTVPQGDLFFSRSFFALPTQGDFTTPPSQVFFEPE